MKRGGVQVFHVLDHAVIGFLGLALFALDVGNDSAFGFGGDHMDIDFVLLPKAPASADRLIKLLV